MRIDYGPGYRVYFVSREQQLVVLLASGDKKSQASDIRTALNLARSLGDQGDDMAKTKTKRWDAADHLKSDRDIIAYLEAAFEDGDSGVVAAALGDIARAKGMTKVARRAGLGRESLYKALSADGNPELGTVLRVVRALGIKLHAVPAR